MGVFEDIEGIFDMLRGLSDYSRALVTLATATGILFHGYYSLKCLLLLFQGFRLYVWSQFCSRVDLKQRYGEWAVVSGATDGIGLAMAKELARRGHSLIIIGRNAEKLVDSKTALEQEPNVGDVLTVQIDLSNSSLENYERIRGQIDADNRDIGILINNAGIGPSAFKRYNDYELKLVHDIVNVNVLATLSLTHMIMPSMLRRGKGLVLNVSSSVAALTAAYWCVYGPSKRFIDSFSEILQMEYSSQRAIDIIKLATGPVHTKFVENFSSAKVATTSVPIFYPSPEDYARSALNAVTTRINSSAGTVMHELYHIGAVIIESLGFTYFYLKLVAKLSGNSIEPIRTMPSI